MADKIIIVKERKRGCGCGAVLALLFAAFGVAVFMNGMGEHDAPATPSPESSQVAPSPTDRPDPSIVQLKFSQALRKYLNDPSSYKPSDTRVGSHPLGYAYLHEYRAKNSFGATVKDMCGILCATNTGKRVWTFYDSDALPDLVKEIKP